MLLGSYLFTRAVGKIVNLKSSNVLQIHQALEVRLVAAEAEIKEAEREKLEKEESALEYLAREESRMQKVVQESKILEQQAEENSKVVDCTGLNVP